AVAWRSSASTDQRNAARVLPDPVGAAISVSAPAAMAGHPASCAGVAVPKRAPNQRDTSGENDATPPPCIPHGPSIVRRGEPHATSQPSRPPAIEARVSRKTGRSRQQQQQRQDAAKPDVQKSASKSWGGRAAARRPQVQRSRALPIAKRVVWCAAM